VEIGKNGRLFLIVKGIAITLKQRADGKQMGIECLEKGDIIGISNILQGRSGLRNFLYEERTGNLLLSDRRFFKSLFRFSDNSRQVIRSLSHRFAQAVVKLEHVTLDNRHRKNIVYLFQKLRGEQPSLEQRCFPLP
jgi:CRP-like cAMP-binding protein